MGNKPIKVRVALDSVIYAPVYVFIQRNSIQKSPSFRFHIEDVSENFRFSLDPAPPFLRAIEYDPVFSCVMDPDNYRSRTWFGIGDPLRVRRLVLGKKSLTERYNFVGTLVSQLALWLITESRIGERARDVGHYNYVGCHPEGMTGHVFSKFLFKNPHHDPLAPVKEPGSELKFLTKLLKQDIPRRVNYADPVWFGAVSTEIDEAVNCRTKPTPLSYRFLFDIFENSNIPKDYLFTSIVARGCAVEQSEIEEATGYLHDGLLKSIGMLRDPAQRPEFIRLLHEFYRSHRAFRVSTKSVWPYLQKKFLKEVMEKIYDIYPADLLSNRQAVTNTDEWLEYALSGFSTTEKQALFNRIRTSTWRGEGLLWKRHKPNATI